ncbi:MAG TPA: hypothetical protein PLB78_07645, partial [Anaerolineae bacterium]|nr:hypothetical protein [Anaerolineae bacterium]
RAVIQVTAPRPGERRLSPPADLCQRWLDPDYAVAAAEEELRLTYFGGEALPIFWPNLGPDVFAAYLGCSLELGEATTWAQPCLATWGDLARIQLRLAGPWWQATVRLLEAAGERLAGACLIGLTDLHGGGDALAALRGPQAFAFDLVDDPAEVKAAMQMVAAAWFEVYERQFAITQRWSPGTTTWLGLWSPGRWYPVSCDFGCMVSGAMFAEFFLPELLGEIAYLDHALFHLDGPGALHHLDALLAIDKLAGIQWEPGPMPRAMLPWLPALRCIQAAGKRLHITVLPHDVEPLLRALEPEGLCLSTRVDSPEEAQDLLCLATRLAPKRDRR